MPDSAHQVSERLSEIFMPYATAKVAEAKKSRSRFVHYTTAENALKIIRERRIFLRNTVCMNDYREFAHGMDYLLEFFHNPEDKKTIFDALNQVSQNLAEDAIGLFDKWLPHNEYNVFVTCISEHNDWEDDFGRLSMWRAYSRPGAVGVALIINSEAFFQESDLLKAYGSPVAYFTRAEFKESVAAVVSNIASNIEFLRSIPRDLLVGSIYNMLLFAAASLKHPGFKEEQEWRLIHLPKQAPSTILERSVETISGVPQTIYKIPLEKFDGLNITLSALLNKLLIGPSNFPLPLYTAFVEELREAGVANADSLVSTSDIPLRT